MNSVKHDIDTPFEQTFTERRQTPLSECITTAMERYFNDLEGHNPQKLYDMVMSEIEHPLLKVVMKEARGNQCKAAEILGINRGTLRKKLEKYGLL